jgi:hypothetical protein
LTNAAQRLAERLSFAEVEFEGGSEDKKPKARRSKKNEEATVENA